MALAPASPFARKAAFIWGIFLLTLTSWPKPPPVPVLSSIPDFDKAVHFVLYAVEAFLLYRAVSWPGRPRFSLTRAAAIVGAMAVWGVADETHQAWIPGRSMEAGDVGADVAGAAVGALVASVTHRSRAAARATFGAGGRYAAGAERVQTEGPENVRSGSGS